MLSGVKSGAVQHVLMTADTVGGVWTYALELARSLNDIGVRVSLATMGAPVSGPQAQEAAAVPRLELHESSFKLEWMEEPWAEVEAAGEWLLELETKLRPDIVQLNGYAHGNLPWRAPAMVVAHSCVLSWWQAVRHENAPGKWNEYRRRVANGIRGADAVAGISRWMLQQIDSHYGPLPRAVVIPNGRAPSHFRTGPKQDFILTSGRLWDDAKNVKAVCAAAGSLGWPVYVAGERLHPEGGSAELNNVRLLGRVDTRSISDWFARASIYALPARYEPFGLSILEAAYSGCALVLGNIESLRENWDDAALFVPPDDPEIFREAVEALIGSESLRRDMGNRARQRALQFTSNRMALAYLALYASLVRTATPLEAGCAL